MGNGKGARTRLLEDPHCFPRQPPHDPPRALCVAHPVPPGAAIPPANAPRLVELNRVLLRLWVRGIPHERDALVDLDDGGVQGGRAADVEVEYLWAGLVPDEEEVFEPAGDEEGVFVAFALEEGVGGYCGG